MRDGASAAGEECRGIHDTLRQNPRVKRVLGLATLAVVECRGGGRVIVLEREQHLSPTSMALILVALGPAVRLDQLGWPSVASTVRLGAAVELARRTASFPGKWCIGLTLG